MTTRQPFKLTREQYDLLIDGISDSRIGKNPKGFSHVEAWDDRRWLIRIFGFGGFDIETRSLELVAQLEHPAAQAGGKSRWTIVYRAEVRLTIRDQFGSWAVFEDASAGDASNQPSLGDAHENAMKTALSQALKRCCVNLGDQFGLSLYNDGKTAPVVRRSVIAPEAGGPTEPIVPTDDEPVLPEPGTEPMPVDEPTQEKPAPTSPTETDEDRRQRAVGLRDWALKPERTGDELRTAHANLTREHPATAKVLVVNETGDDELLAVLIQRRIHDGTTPAAVVEKPAVPTPTGVTDEQHRHMHALWREVGYAGDANRDNRLIAINRILGRSGDKALTSSKDLTLAEADQVIAALKDRRAALQGANA